jgi:copper(I)-binding protein
MTLRSFIQLARSSFVAIALTICTTHAFAHEYTLGSIRIIHPWARATPPGAPTGGAYLALENKGPDDRLISASTQVSESVEMHSMSMQGNVMQMQKLDKGIALPAGKTVTFAPGVLHIMLINLKAPLKEGQSFPMHLKFEKAGEINVDVKVGSLTEGTGGEHMH